jgi:TctA family transporter
MAISQGDATVFLSRPLSAALLATAVLIVAVSLFAGRHGAGAPPAEAGT